MEDREGRASRSGWRPVRSLRDRTVWITGASSGIGEALAVECFGQGARLVLSARTEEKLQALRDRLHSTPETPTKGGTARVEIYPLDVANPRQVETAADKVRAIVGPIDLFIHAAGVSQRSLGAETGMEVVRQIMETNFFGVVGLTRTVLPAFLERGSGHLVVISSAFGKFGGPGRSAYAASKHALHGYFDSLRSELPPALRITLVAPGAIATNISSNALTAGGSSYGIIDEGISGGMSPERCARKIVRAILKGRDEVLVGVDLRLAMALLLKKLAPRLLSALLRRVKMT